MKRILAAGVLCFFLVPLACENGATEPEIAGTDIDVRLGVAAGSKVKPGKVPDEYVAFTRFDFGGTNTLDVLLLNLQNPGSGWIDVARTEGVDEGFSAWSPSGDQIVYSAGGSDPRTWDLHIVSVIGSPPAVGTPTKLSVKGHRPNWSPDGKYIAYECYGTPSGPLDNTVLGDICYITKGPTGNWGNPQNLTNTPSANERFPSWSPGSDKIVFERWTQPGGVDIVDLYTVDLNKNRVTQLTNTPTFDERMPAWSVKDEIAFSEGGTLNWPIACPPDNKCEPFDTYAGLWTMPVAKPLGASRLTSTAGDTAPHWTANGNQIFFSGDGPTLPWGDVWPDVFVIDRQGTNRLNLTNSGDGEFWGRLRP